MTQYQNIKLKKYIIIYKKIYPAKFLELEKEIQSRREEIFMGSSHLMNSPTNNIVGQIINMYGYNNNSPNRVGN